jgi:hypothetical protein
MGGSASGPGRLEGGTVSRDGLCLIKNSRLRIKNLVPRPCGIIIAVIQGSNKEKDV